MIPPSARGRRDHSLLLSGQGTTIKDIAKTSQVHRVTVSAWITNWEHHGHASLHDTPRSGRPSILSPEEQEIALHYIQEEPRSRKGVMERIANTTDKRLSLSSLNRLAKRGRLRWKRVRKSPGALALSIISLARGTQLAGGAQGLSGDGAGQKRGFGTPIHSIRSFLVFNISLVLCWLAFTLMMIREHRKASQVPGP